MSPPPPMAHYKVYDYAQTHLIPVSLEQQLLRGTLEHTIHLLVDRHLDLSLFDARYKNDETGCPAYDLKILLKVVLFAYSRGIIGSRRIEQLCRTHVICMALACMQRPDHSTIAAFVSSMQDEILSVFCEVLLICEEQQLLGGPVFALDGLKLPSNASKAWSGTLEELQHKQEKLDAKIADLLTEHQQADAEDGEETSLTTGTPACGAGEEAPPSHKEPLSEPVPSDVPQADGSEEVDMPTPNEDIPRYATSSKVSSSSRPRSSHRTHKKTPPPRRRSKKTKAQKKAERLTRWRRHAQRLKTWLAVHEPKIGQRGKEIKSNVIDNDSAKMATSHGVIQGDNAQALVDDQPQSIVAAEAFGDGQDAQHLTRIMPRAKTIIQRLGWGTQGFRDTTWLADSSYFSDGNLNTCDTEHLNAYIPDDLFRQRDPRFADQARYTPKKKKTPRFGRDDLTHDEATDGYRCPNGMLLRLKAREHRVRHRSSRDYASDKQDCQGCPFRATCPSKKTSKQKHLSIPVHEPVTKPKSRGHVMKEKIDTPEGKQQYRRRLAIVEPVFANIRTQKHLDHLTLRGKDKEDIQWMLYAIVHHIEKLANYGELA